MQTEKLIYLAQRGDKSALDKLIRLYYDSVYSYCYHHVGNRQEAEDLCHDTFCSILQNLENYHHVGKFQNYLYVVAGNKCKNYYRKRRELPMETLPEQAQPLQDAGERAGIKELVDVEAIADRLFIMKGGQILASGAAAELEQNVRHKVWTYEGNAKEAEKIAKAYLVANIHHLDGKTVYRIIAESRPFYTATEERGTLEDLYLYYFKETKGD